MLCKLSAKIITRALTVVNEMYNSDALFVDDVDISFHLVRHS